MSRLVHVDSAAGPQGLAPSPLAPAAALHLRIHFEVHADQQQKQRSLIIFLSSMSASMSAQLNGS